MAAPNPTLGGTIVQRLEEMDRSQGWLARQLGISQSNVSGWVKRGRVPRSLDMQERLAAALGFSSYGALLQGAAPDREPEVHTRALGGGDPGEADYQDQVLATLRSIDMRLALLIDELRKGRREE